MTIANADLPSAKPKVVSYGMSLAEIEKAMERLGPAEFAEFGCWLDEVAEGKWDQRFAADVAAGKLDSLGKKAIADFEAGRCTEL